MPTIYHEGDVWICIYPDDHSPPHFHIRTTQGECQVSLADLTIMRGTIRRQQYEVAMRWVAGNIALLRDAWERLNG